MTAIDPRSLAAEIVRRVLDEGSFAAAVLSSAIDAHPQLAPRDRALLTELVYGTLRAARYLEGRIGQLATRGAPSLDPETRAHLLVAAFQIVFLDRVPAHAAVFAAVESVKASRNAKVAGFANAVLRRLARELPEHRMDIPDAVVAGAPRWLRRALDRALGEGGSEAFLRAGPFPPPLGLRVRRGDRQVVIDALRGAAPGATVLAGAVARDAILMSGAGDPRRLPGVADGSLVVQEEGSQVVAESLGARPGDRVLDACAGRGNKAIFLSDAVGSAGTVDVADLHPKKLERLAIEVAHAQAAVGDTFAVDWTVGPGDVPLGTYDRVLVDAPCSGVGTLRRRPEILLARTESDIQELSTKQSAILRNARLAVKPGGMLVYAVCSVLREEVEDVFASVPELEVISVRRLLPQDHGTDGYAIAVLREREI